MCTCQIIWRKNFMVMIIFIIIIGLKCVFIWACFSEDVLHMLFFTILNNFCILQRIKSSSLLETFIAVPYKSISFSYQRRWWNISIKKFGLQKVRLISWGLMQASDLVWKGRTSFGHYHIQSCKFLTVFHWCFTYALMWYICNLLCITIKMHIYHLG